MLLVNTGSEQSFTNRIHSFINSFIADIYIASLQVGLLRSAPSPSAAKECYFKLVKEFLGEYPMKWPESQWEVIPYQKGQPRRRPGVSGQSIPLAGLYLGLKRARLDYTWVYY